MGDPRGNHPGVHPESYRRPWDGRSKEPRDAAERLKREEQRQAQRQAVEAHSAAEGKLAARRRIQRVVATVPFERRRFLKLMAAWEAAGRHGPAPVPEEERPPWAAELVTAYGTWAAAAALAQIVDYVDPGGVVYKAPAW